MPDADGFEVLRAIRETDPGECVLFLTAPDAVEDRVQRRSARVDLRQVRRKSAARAKATGSAPNAGQQRNPRRLGFVADQRGPTPTRLHRHRRGHWLDPSIAHPASL